MLLTQDAEDDRQGLTEQRLGLGIPAPRARLTARFSRLRAVSA